MTNLTCILTHSEARTASSLIVIWGQGLGYIASQFQQTTCLSSNLTNYEGLSIENAELTFKIIHVLVELSLTPPSAQVTSLSARAGKKFVTIYETTRLSRAWVEFHGPQLNLLNSTQLAFHLSFHLAPVQEVSRAKWINGQKLFTDMMFWCLGSVDYAFREIETFAAPSNFSCGKMNFGWRMLRSPS